MIKFIWKYVLAIVTCLALISCGNPSLGVAGINTPSNWIIGPIVNGNNLSPGMPLHPSAEPGGWGFDIPQASWNDTTDGNGNGAGPAKHVHYITMPFGSLKGYTQIRMKFKLTLPDGVTLHPRTSENSPTIITLYFQRKGDNWTADGKYETYRWYAAFANICPIQPGEYELVAPLDGAWSAILSSTHANNPAAFQDAINNAESVGFVLGGGDGLGHGIFAEGGNATTTAHLTIEEFAVE